ncbi:beta-glucosidase BglX, partial [Saprospiraceae bacterium]|nr:beta-glucosidase BglX [Saprospiraceae bacterium]
VRKIQKIAVESSRLGIPLIFGYDVIHGYKVQAPIPLAEAASWDMALIENSSRIAAKEATAAGLNWTFAPMVDISRDARWGRVMEGGGEDPYLGSLIAAARVRGFQGDDLSDVTTMAACTKHFAGYGFAESGRDYNTVDMSGVVLHNVILPPFKATVDAGVLTFMNAFNTLNGVPATSNAFLQRDILKGKWGFNGFVVSDWGSVGEVVTHGQAATPEEAAELSVAAGSDMDMESYYYINHLKNLVDSSRVRVADIDDAARRILNVKYKLGLFDDPYKYCDEEREKSTLYADENKAGVLQVAKKSIVLLKNENDLLPLKKGQKVAVIGPMTSEKSSVMGSWRLASDDNTAVSLEEGLSKYEDMDWSFHQGVKLLDKPASFVFETKINTTDRTGIKEAVEAAKSADVVIMALGEHGFQSGEGRSRQNIDLPGLQQELLEAVYEVNKNIVLVLNNGRPLAITWADENLPAIVEAWQLGSESGNAIAEVLMGDYNPSGKLPMTFPKHVAQLPLYYNQKSTGRPAKLPNEELVFWSHYIDGSNDPLYAFGHGLSYTTFEYSDFRVVLDANNNMVAKVKVTNTGDVPGEEVAQLYIHDVAASITRPIMELKGFQKIKLAAGRAQVLSFTLTDKELGFFNEYGQYLVEPGLFEVMVGGSSAKVLKQKVIRK